MAEALAIAAHTGAVFMRQFLVWRRIFWASISTNVANPILLLFAFGFGLGSVIDVMGGVGYLAYIVPGMMAYSAMFAASFETTVGSYARFYLQKTWDAVLATPVGLLELLMGEALWAAAKGTFAAFCVLIAGILFGGVPSIAGGLLSLPLIFLASLCFAVCGQVAMAYSKSWEFFSYFFTFWVTPMFVFSGVFFGIERFPDWIEGLAWILPMTHLIEIVRPLALGQHMGLASALGHSAYLVALMCAAFAIAYRKLKARMFD
ncbi:MAG: ABC transporter permease [Geminicoccaceae bacterium]